MQCYTYYSIRYGIRESSLIWQGGRRGGGWRYWNSKLEILAAPLDSSSIFRSAPPSCWFWSIQIFGAPPPLLAQQFFQSPPFGCLKIFGAPPAISSSPLPVKLNELKRYKSHYCRFELIRNGVCVQRIRARMDQAIFKDEELDLNTRSSTASNLQMHIEHRNRYEWTQVHTSNIRIHTSSCE